MDLRIPNDVYAQVEEIAKANNEPTHHITGNIILTPTLVKLIRLGIRSLSDHYPTLATLATASEQLPDTLTPANECSRGRIITVEKASYRIVGQNIGQLIGQYSSVRFTT